MEIDLHGYHPSEIDVPDLLRQAWETGASEVTIVHGHGRNRGLSPGFFNTNTGHFGLFVRREIRFSNLKPWVKISSLDRSDAGSTTVKLRPNPNPTRTVIDLPERVLYPASADFRQ